TQEHLDLVALEVDVLFLIHADDLLGTGDDARFRRRRAPHDDEGARVGIDRRHHRAQRLAARVVADGGDEIASRTDCRYVLSNVRRAAQRVPAFADPDNGDRRFRRDALHVPTKVDVEHGIADDGDPAILGPLEKAQDAIAWNR